MFSTGERERESNRTHAYYMQHIQLSNYVLNRVVVMVTHTCAHVHTHTESSSVPADQVDMEPEEDGGRETKHGRQKIAEDDLELVRRTVMEHITLQCVRVCVCVNVVVCI